MTELKSKTFILRMTETEYHRLKKYAQADNMFMAEYVRKLINDKTNHNNGEKRSSNVS